MQFFSSGIYSEEACRNSTNINHAMLVVGYTDEYWIVRNRLTQ